ncbi:MAG TPA: ABC transporter permease [Chloroflexota bacterium]|nr:ABC transporter permease [Chloroflexota bacterium]
MEFLASVGRWCADPAHWQGTDGIPVRLGEHVVLSAVALLCATAIALPIGVALGHTGRGGVAAINVANIGRALPSMAMLAFALPVAFALHLGLGFWPTMLAMVPLGIPAVLTNSYVAIRVVDRDVVDVAHAVGMTEWQVLRHVELPLAASIIVAGVRNAAVAIVATATLGALVASGGLGRYIVDGLARQEYERLFVGAVLVALLSVATEWAFGLVERAVVSPGSAVDRSQQSDVWRRAAPSSLSVDAGRG